MKHVWSIICKQSITDKDTNLVSLIESIEELHIRVDAEKLKEQKKIILLNPFEIVHYFLKDKDKSEEQGSVIVEIIFEKKVIAKILKEVSITSQFKRIRVRTLFQSFSFEKEGEYLFNVKFKPKGSKDFKKVCEIPLLIVFEK